MRDWGLVTCSDRFGMVDFALGIGGVVLGEKLVSWEASSHCRVEDSV